MSARHLPRDAGLGVLAWAAPLALAFFLTPVVVENLGAKDYGQFAFFSGLGSLLLLGTGRALLHHAPTASPRDVRAGLATLLPSALALALIAGLAAALLIALGATLVFGTVPWTGVLLAGLLATVGGLLQTIGVVPHLLGRFPFAAIVTAGSAILWSISAAVLASRGGSWTALLMLQSAVAVLTIAALAGFAVSHLRGQTPRAPHASALRSLARFAMTVGVAQVAGALLVVLERVVVTSQGPAAMASYALALMLCTLLHAAVQHASTMLVPLASGAFGDERESRLLDMYRRGLALVVYVAVFVVISLVICGATFMDLWIGGDLARESADIVRILAPTFGVLAVLVLPWQVADARGYPGRNVALTCASLVVGVVAGPWLAQDFGAQGMALARATGLLIAPIYIISVERRVFGRVQSDLWLALAWRVVLAGAVVCALETALLARWPASWLTLVGTLGLGLGAYAALLGMTALVSRHGAGGTSVQREVK